MQETRLTDNKWYKPTLNRINLLQNVRMHIFRMALKKRYILNVIDKAPSLYRLSDTAYVHSNLIK